MSCGGSSCVGVAMFAVLSRLAAIVNRMWLSVLRVAVTTHAGHPRVRHQSASSVMKHWRPMNALRDSPEKASSRSEARCVQSAAEASVDAREKRVTTGMMRAWSMSRWRRYVCFAWGEHCECVAQKLPCLLVLAPRIDAVVRLGQECGGGERYGSAIDKLASRGKGTTYSASLAKCLLSAQKALEVPKASTSSCGITKGLSMGAAYP